MRLALLSCAIGLVGCAHDNPGGRASIAIDGDGGGMVIAAVDDADPVTCTRSCELPTDGKTVHLQIFSQDVVTSPCGDRNSSCDVATTGADIDVHFDLADPHEKTSLYLAEPILDIAFLGGDLIVETKDPDRDPPVTLHRIHLDGTEVWQTPATVSGLLQADTDLITITGSPYGVEAFRADGSMAWSSGAQVSSVAFGSSGDVIVTNDSASVYAVDRATGEVQWRSTNGYEGIFGSVARDSAGTVAFSFAQTPNILRFDTSGAPLAPFTPPLGAGVLLYAPNGDLVVASRDTSKPSSNIAYTRITPDGTATTVVSDSGLATQRIWVAAQGDDFFEVHRSDENSLVVSLLDPNASAIWSVDKPVAAGGGAVCDGNGLCAISGDLDDCEPSHTYGCSWIELFSTP